MEPETTFSETEVLFFYFSIYMIQLELRRYGRLKPDGSGLRLIPERFYLFRMWFDSTDLRTKESVLRLRSGWIFCCYFLSERLSLLSSLSSLSKRGLSLTSTDIPSDFNSATSKLNDAGMLGFLIGSPFKMDS